MDLDAQSYFFQFALGASVQRFFGVRGKGFRCLLCRLPQGWEKAPAIAQTAACALIHDIGDPADPTSGALAWIDNFILGGTTFTAASHVVDTFLTRCTEISLTLKPSSHTPTQFINVLGVDFNLKASCYRIDPKWAEDSAFFLFAFCAEIRRGWRATRRVIWQAFGKALWSAAVYVLPLGEVLWSVTDFMRKHTPKVHSSQAWEELFSVPELVLHDLLAMAQRLRINAWLPPPKPTASILDCDSLLLTDASLWAAAFMVTFCPPFPVYGSNWQWVGKSRHAHLGSISSPTCPPKDTHPYLQGTVGWLTECDPARIRLSTRATPPPAF